MRRKRSSVSRTSATTAHSSMSLSAASFRASSRCVGRAGRRGRSSRNRTLAGRFRPRSGSVYQSRNPCCARTPAAPSAQYTATVQAHDPPEHRLVPAYRIRYCYSMSSGDHTAESGGAFLPSCLSGLRRRGRCRAECRAVAERSGRGGKGPRMCCWSKWPVGQSDPIGYWLVAAAVLEPEPLPTVVITTKGRWRIVKRGE
jgi:hypothetical protein